MKTKNAEKEAARVSHLLRLAERKMEFLKKKEAELKKDIERENDQFMKTMKLKDKMVFIIHSILFVNPFFNIKNRPV